MAAKDELCMAKLRLRFPNEYEIQKKTDVHVIQQYEVPSFFFQLWTFVFLDWFLASFTQTFERDRWVTEFGGSPMGYKTANCVSQLVLKLCRNQPSIIMHFAVIPDPWYPNEFGMRIDDVPRWAETNCRHTFVFEKAPGERLLRTRNLSCLPRTAVNRGINLFNSVFTKFWSIVIFLNSKISDILRFSGRSCVADIACVSIAFELCWRWVRRRRSNVRFAVTRRWTEKSPA